MRSVGEDHEPRMFDVAGPLVLAGIGILPAAMKDRSITISLRRRLAEEKIDRLRSNRAEHLDVLGRRVARWVEDHYITLCNNDDPALPEILNDRAQDNWRPLIAIADVMSPALGERARAAALTIEADEGDDDDNAAIMALADVAKILELRATDRISTQDLVDALVEMEDRPWREWKRGHPLSANSLSRLLKPFNIRPKKMRFEGSPRPGRGYEAAPIREAAARYVEVESDLDAGDIGF